MADTADSGLSFLTGANVAVDDFFRVVDKSDTSTFPAGANGANKRIRADELAAAMSVLAQYFAPTGLPGATIASRYVGATATGSPTTGTFALGDWCIAIVLGIPSVFVCTTAGTIGGACVFTQLSAAPQNRLAFDTLWAAVGDIVIGNGNDAAVILPVSTVAGRAVVADPNATSKLSWSDPVSVGEAQSGGGLIATYNRFWTPSSVTGFTPTSGTLYLFLIALPKGITVANLTVWAGTTAGASLTHSWMAISNNSRVRQAISADNTTATWTASTSRTFAMTSPYTTTAASSHYLWLTIVGTTPPTIEAVTGLTTTGARNAAPKPSGSSDTGQTVPGSAPSTATGATSIGSFAYIEVS